MTAEPGNDGDRDIIARCIEAHPELWGDGADPLSPAFVDRVVADIVSGSRMARHRQRDSSRRRRILAAGLLSTAVVAGSAVGVAALVRLGQPTQPGAGIACRSESGADADVIVIEPTTDALGGCRELWREGRFDGAAGPITEVPPLVACISSTGAIEVYPGSSETCRSLGLIDAEPTLDPSNQALVALQERVAAEINAGPCASADDAHEHARRLLEETNLVGWRVQTLPDSAAATCAKATVDVTGRIIQIVKFP